MTQRERSTIAHRTSDFAFSLPSVDFTTWWKMQTTKTREAPVHPYFGPERTRPPQEILDVSPKRSIAKAISWRVLGTLDTLL